MPLDRLQGAPSDVEDVQALVDAWIGATLARDASTYADLFLRDPQPFAAWPGGDVSHGWAAIHDHALRELYHAKTVVQRVDPSGLRVIRLTDETLVATFDYLVEARDLWGTTLALERHASWTLLRTKDGLRIASAHFAARPR